MFVGAAAALQPCAGSRVGWSPDGSQVVFCATGPDGAGLYTANVTTGAIRKLAAQARKHKTPEEAAKEAAHHAEMAKLYAQHVLKEQPTLKIQGLGGPKKKAVEPAEVLHKPTV